MGFSSEKMFKIGRNMVSAIQGAIRITPPTSSIICQPLKHLSILSPSLLWKSNPLPDVNQTRFMQKRGKLPNHMYGGFENMGLDYGVEVCNAHRKGPHVKTRKNRNPLGPGIPYAKAVVIRPVVKKPKKPNSANRKCVLVRTSAGRELTAYVPGEGHNLQEHNVVLIRPGNLQDVPGVKTKCVRGKYDLAHVVKKSN